MDGRDVGRLWRGAILAGRGDETGSSLEEALSLSRELKNDAMIAQILAWQGDTFYVQGDPKLARPLYERSLQAASHSTERDKVLIAKVNLAKLDVQEGRAPAALASLRPLAQQAQELGLKYIALECSISMGEALIQTKSIPPLDRNWRNH